jgi:hypothetical protein
MILVIFLAIMFSLLGLIFYKNFFKTDRLRDKKEFWLLFIFPVGVRVIKLRRIYREV